MLSAGEVLVEEGKAGLVGGEGIRPVDVHTWEEVAETGSGRGEMVEESPWLGDLEALLG